MSDRLSELKKAMLDDLSDSDAARAYGEELLRANGVSLFDVLRYVLSDRRAETLACPFDVAKHIENLVGMLAESVPVPSAGLDAEEAVRRFNDRYPEHNYLRNPITSDIHDVPEGTLCRYPTRNDGIVLSYEGNKLLFVPVNRGESLVPHPVRVTSLTSGEWVYGPDTDSEAARAWLSSNVPF